MALPAKQRDWFLQGMRGDVSHARHTFEHSK
jgi:hypothetical protein